MTSTRSVLLTALAIIAAGWLWFAWQSFRPAQTVPTRPAVRDSVVARRSLDSAALVEYGRMVESARGDSLAALLAAQAGRIRTRWLPARLDTLVLRDTVRDSVLVAGRDVRAVMLSDSACTVRADSLAGVALLDSLEIAELRRRPESCGTWSAFGTGFGLGATAAAGTCVLVR